MKLTIEKSTLLKALGHVQTVVERRTVTPILANVLLEGTDGKLKLTATDLDISIQEETSAKVQQKGSATVSAHTFYDIVRKLPDGSDVELSHDASSGQFQLLAGRSNFTLPSLPAEDFSNIKTSDFPHSFVVTSEELRHLLASTRFAMSTEEARYYLNGIYLHTKKVDNDIFLRTVATDGHRLAMSEIPEPDGADGMPDVIIPRKTIAEATKVLENMEGNVKVSLSHTQIAFNLGAVQITSRLIDGSFPDYEKVIPYDNQSVLTISRKSFAEAVDRIATISSDKTRSIKITIESNKVQVSVSNSDQGSGAEEIEATYDGKRLSIGFNARYVLDICQQVESDTLKFLLADETAPAIIRGLEDEGSLYVLMPMRV